MISILMPSSAVEAGRYRVLRNAVLWLEIALLYAGLAEAGRRLAFEIDSSGFIFLWAPAGLLLAAFLRLPVRRWWIPGSAALVGNLVFDSVLHDAPWHLALAFWAANVVGGLAGGALMKLSEDSEFNMERVRDAGWLMSAGVLSSALVASGATVVVSMQTGSRGFPFWAKTFWGDGLGILLIAPLLLAWTAPSKRRWSLKGLRGWRLAEGTAVLISTIGLTLLVFHQHGDLANTSVARPFWIFLVVLWVGLRFPPRFACFVAWFAALIAMSETAVGRGPFAVESQPVESRILMIQGFAGVVALTSLALSASVTSRRRVEQELEVEKSLLQDFFDQASDLIGWSGPDGIIISGNRAWQTRLGYSNAEICGVHYADFLHPHSRYAWRALIQELKQGAKYASAELVFLAKDGRELIAEVSGSAYGPNGDLLQIRTIARDVTSRREKQAERERLIAELQTALLEVKTLRGFIPICAGCKKIRTEAGAWQELEEYLTPRMEGGFTHGLCETCGREQFGEFWDQVADEIKNAERNQSCPNPSHGAPRTN